MEGMMDGWKGWIDHEEHSTKLSTNLYGMGHEKVPVFCKTTIVQRKLCSVPVRFTYFHVYFLLREQNYFTHVQR